MYAAKRTQRISDLITWVEEQLRKDWSPEQIASSVRAMGYPVISDEWIYRHIERDKAARSGRIIDRAGIEERPVVDERANLVFIGPPGVGKTYTYLTIGIGQEAIETGYKVLFTTALAGC